MLDRIFLQLAQRERSASIRCSRFDNVQRFTVTFRNNSFVVVVAVAAGVASHFPVSPVLGTSRTFSEYDQTHTDTDTQTHPTSPRARDGHCSLPCGGRTALQISQSAFVVPAGSGSKQVRLRGAHHLLERVWNRM